MITAIEIENFKAVGPRQRIEVRPITLLFGPNSAGKSTILQAIHYAREIFERRNIDADRTVIGGEFIDLGGFHNFVHGHVTSARLVLKFEFEMEDVALPDFMYAKSDDVVYSMPTRRIGEQVRAASVEVSLEWSELEQRPVIATYVVGINGEELGQLDYQPGRKSIQLSRLNWMHSIFSDVPNVGNTPQEHPLFSHYLKAFRRDPYDTPYEVQISLSGQADAMPEWDKVLPIDFRLDEDADTAEEHAVEEFSACITQLIAGPGQVLRDLLRDCRYLGPLREKPDRKYRPPRFAEPSRWSSGLGAWDVLYTAGPRLLNNVNRWLSSDPNEDELDEGLSPRTTLESGYRIHRKKYKEIDVESLLAVQLLNGRAFDEELDLGEQFAKLPTDSHVTLVEQRTRIHVEPQDVGEGISQILPVVVALLAPGPNLVLVEQPELHVHPRMQVAIGDLLIERTHTSAAEFGSAEGRSREIAFIETHSEHLLLRLLRRVRETTEQKPIRPEYKLRPTELAILYVEPFDDGVRFQELRVDDAGEFKDRWPQGFFDERAKELFG